MQADRWNLIRGFVEAAMKLPAEQRASYLAGAVAEGDLRREVESLLEQADGASEIFGNKTWLPPELDTPEPDLQGAVLGNYRLLRELGRGGMGAVYLAERADGLYQQQVALKLLQENVVSPRLIERFSQERQILARLNHAGIARLLDGGVMADGRPYLVLEYVEGQPIDRFCDDSSLSLAARLRLFLCVAEAVQSAHQQFVLHLDLKPANILVSPDGEPHLLDFGIAQLVGADGASGDAAEATMRMMTPRYASPEQAAGLPLGVPSDVFSLATLLYRLLTGRLPYAVEGLSALETARVIREQAPAAPSMVAPPELRASLRGDLDTILLQALRKEPERRYPTVAAMAADVQRHLESKPVQAHADSLRYRTGKFVRRNRVPVLTAAIAAVLLVASGVAVVRSAIVARRQRAVAERRLSDARGLAHSYVFDLDTMLEEVPGTIHIRHFVLENAQKYLEAMSSEPGNDEYLEKEMAEGYHQIGRVQALPGMPSMSDWRAAAISQAKGIAIERRIVARHPEKLDEIGVLVRHLLSEEQVYQTVGDIDHVQQIEEEAWSQASRIVAAGPKTKGYMTASIVAWSIAVLHCGNGDDWNLADPGGSLVWLQRSEDIAKLYMQSNPGGSNYDTGTAMLERVAISRASLAEHSEDPRKARPYFEQAMALTSGESLIEKETRKQLMGFYADYLLNTGDAKGALAAAPAPSASSVHERGTDRSLSADEADEVQLRGRIDLALGNYAAGRRETEAGLKAYDAMFANLPEDAALSSAIAHSHFDYAEQRKGVPEAVRRQHYDLAMRTAEDFRRRQPHALSASYFLAQCYAGLAQMAADHGDRAEQKRMAAPGITNLEKVLGPHPDHPEARILMGKLRQLAG